MKKKKLNHREKLRLARKLERQSGGHIKYLNIFEHSGWVERANAIERKVEKRIVNARHRKLMKTLEKGGKNAKRHN